MKSSDEPSPRDIATTRAERVSAVLDQLTLEEKLHLLYGDMRSGGVERLGISELVCADGPLGLRLMANKHKPTTTPADDEVQTEGLAAASFSPTAFPATLALAASFDVNAAAMFGRMLPFDPDRPARRRRGGRGVGHRGGHLLGRHPPGGDGGADRAIMEEGGR
ncbi:MAG: hypothetical protein ACOC7R_05230 [Planctomycetota bacterium]